jgi:23S rRNA pseudouridine1911/1915/1917 synthase
VAEADFTFTVAPEEAGARLDVYLAARLGTASRAQIQRAIENEEISVNDRPTKASYKVRAADSIEGEVTSATPLTAAPEPIPLEIVYEDAELIVVNKPAGMVVHPGAGVHSGTLANALVYHFENAAVGDPLRPGIVHRLDVGTSGLIVAAKTEQAHLDLATQFADRQVEKLYLALAYGAILQNEGRIETNIGRDPRQRVKMAVLPTGRGRSALTLYRVRQRVPDFTLLEVEIKTGRTHQIRVHLASIKHPVVGDETYDNGRGKTLKDPQLRAKVSRLGRPFLHATSLAFTHPVTRYKMEFTAELPTVLSDFLADLANGQGALSP